MFHQPLQRTAIVSAARSYTFTLLCVLTVAGAVAAQPSAKQARNAITHMPGFALTNGAVRIKSVAVNGPAAEVIADVRTVFRFTQNESGKWRIAEIRTGQDMWESLDLIANAAGANLASHECNGPDPPFKGAAAIDPSVRRARCLVGALTGIEVPSDAVRIQEVEPFVVPLASQASATVVAWIRVNARLVSGSKGWQVSELRTGNRDWIKMQSLIDSLNATKKSQALADMRAMAQALEQYRRDRGFYVVSDSHAVLIDHLSPRYLAKVIRVDPWNHPYEYEGQRERFLLRSTGPDGKDHTADDIETSR
ncbi:MAG TPA: type II secretion system protein GspG [Pyrinomonadaceae bacterium]|nr:type II secretion system protein GspG [Pyrinomonadaceae bacterium]